MDHSIALIQGEDRGQNIKKALDTISGEIDLHQKRGVLVKPNLVATERAEANTSPDAVRTVLEFIRQQYDGPVTIAEGAALCNTMEASEYRNSDAMGQTSPGGD